MLSSKLDRLIVLVVYVNVASGCINYGQCIYQNITSDYSPEVRPMRSANDTLMVQVKLEVLSLEGIIEVTETMSIVGYFRVTWTDHRLTWDPEQFGGVQQIVIPANKIWLPDLVVYNSDTSFYEESYRRDFMVQLNHTGYIFWGCGGKISTGCELDMHDYPFDTQNCEIVLESWTYTKDQMDLSFEGPGVKVNETAHANHVWTYRGSTVSSNLKYKNNYRRLVFTLTWIRKRLYYHTNIILPVTLLSLVTLGVFWVPVESGDKVSLAITLMLAFSVFQIIIMEITPVNSNVVPRITQYVLLVSCMATVSLLTSMFVVYINGQVDNKRAPRKLRVFLFRYVAKVLFVSHSSELDLEKDLEMESKYQDVNKQPDSKDTDGFAEDNVDTTESAMSNGSSLLLKGILYKLNDISSQFKESNLSEDVKQEWAFIGRIVDRVLFWITFVLFLVFVIYIFIIQ